MRVGSGHETTSTVNTANNPPLDQDNKGDLHNEICVNFHATTYLLSAAKNSGREL